MIQNIVKIDWKKYLTNKKMKNKTPGSSHKYTYGKKQCQIK